MHSLVDQFRTLLRKSSNEKGETLRVQMNQLIEMLLRNGIQIIGLDTQGSIRLFYTFSSLTGLMYLYELYSTNQLVNTIESLFTLLLDDDRSISLHSLEWNLSDYTICVQCFYLSMKLNIMAGMYESMQPSDDDIRPSSTSLHFDRFPHELIEIMLIKAAS